MLPLAVNHMTCPDFSFGELVDLAAANSCIGVEVRNDLSGDIFSGLDPIKARQLASEKQIRILGLAQINNFNSVSAGALEATFSAAEKLVNIAVAGGAESVCLIPRNDGQDCDSTVRTRNLRTALVELKPLFREAGVVGMIEPLGFCTSSLRKKQEVVDAIVESGSEDCFQLVHDTFHHYLAGEKKCFAVHTGMVHVSGVVSRELTPSQMQDCHRELVNGQDLLNNLDQLEMLMAEGYKGPVSMEVFAPEVHNSPDLAVRLRDSFDFISSGLAARVA